MSLFSYPSTVLEALAGFLRNRAGGPWGAERCDADAAMGLQAERRPHFLGYADEASSLTQGKISVPALAEATFADGTIAFSLRLAPEHAFAYPAIRPFVLIDEVLRDRGQVGIRGWCHIVTHLITPRCGSLFIPLPYAVVV